MTIRSWLKIYFTLFLFCSASTWASSQSDSKRLWSALAQDYKIKTRVIIQQWNTYTFDYGVYDEESTSYISAANRFNSQLRRARVSMSGRPYPNLFFKFTTAVDLVGKDHLSATHGKPNDIKAPEFRLWNLYVQWKCFSDNDLLQMTAGYFPPQIGRESITSAIRSTSFEKSISQNYLRRTIVGVGAGRAAGLNIGGQYIGDRGLGLKYDFGIFHDSLSDTEPTTLSVYYAPILTGRMAFIIGDPEKSNYTISHKINYFGKRNGLTLAVQSSHQSATLNFDRNSTIGIDWLWNYHNLNVDGEFFILERRGMFDANTFTLQSHSAYLRVSYNIHLQDESYLEPVMMFTKFSGPMDAIAQEAAASLQTFSGTDEIIEVGANYYINKNLKLSLFFIANSGSLGEAVPGSEINNFFSQPNGGAIQRGDVLGLSLVAVL